MKDIIKLSVAMDLLDKEIAKLNSQLAELSDPLLTSKLDYLLNLKNEIYSGNLCGIDDFLEKYKEDKL